MSNAEVVFIEGDASSGNEPIPTSAELSTIYDP